MLEIKMKETFIFEIWNVSLQEYKKKKWNYI